MMKPHFSKTFLNKDGYLGIAAILTSVSFSTDERLWHHIELKISDCRNEINLDLRLESDDKNNTYENSVHKIDTLINELTALKVKMAEAKIEYDRRKTISDAKKKDKEPKSLIEEVLDESNNDSGNIDS